MLEQVTNLVQSFLDDTLEEAEEQALTQLCAATLAQWQARLLPEHTPEDCASALISAAAFSALAVFLTARLAGNPCTALTAGDVSMRFGEGKSGLVEQLGALAVSLMRPYTDDGAFSFRGVRG